MRIIAAYLLLCFVFITAGLAYEAWLFLTWWASLL